MSPPKPQPSQGDDQLSDQIRRGLVLGLAIIMLIGSWAAWQFGSDSESNFLSSALGRIGMVMAALWLAWPSLRRPASWLPPGIPILCVLGLCVLAARPKLMIVILPAIGLLTVVAGFARAFRSK